MFDDIFEADFFDDDIAEEDVDYEYDEYDDAYEDVDVFDEDYFEANEGNPINKGRKKVWEYNTAKKYGDPEDPSYHYSSSVRERLRGFRRDNGAGYKDYVQQKRHLTKEQRGDRDVELAKKGGYSRTSMHNLRNNSTYKDRYNDAERRIKNINSDYVNSTNAYNNSVPAKFRKSAPQRLSDHKNIVREMNHPTKT